MKWRTEGGVVDVHVCVMDCDGVIFDSNNLKTGAYRVALQVLGVPDTNIADFVKMHTADASVARDIKFRKFFTDMYPVSNVDEMVERAVQGYADGCMQLYAAMKPVDKAIEFARMFDPAKVNVVSGTAELELQEVFRMHNISVLFNSVRGSPVKKPDHLAEIIERSGASKNHVLFIGDGLTDFRTAQSVGTQFCFLSEMTDWAEAESLMAGAPNVTKCNTWDDILSRVVPNE